MLFLLTLPLSKATAKLHKIIHMAKKNVQSAKKRGASFEAPPVVLGLLFLLRGGFLGGCLLGRCFGCRFGGGLLHGRLGLGGRFGYGLGGHVGVVLVAHEGVAEVAGGVEGLLDGLGRGPTDEVEVGAGLVVGAAGAGAAEGLLAYHRSGGLVVIVDVAGGVFEDFGAAAQGLAVGREDGAGEGVGRGLVAEAEGLLVLGVLIDIDGDDGSEDFLAHRLVVGFLGQDDGGLHEPAFALVAVAAEDDFGVAALLGVVDVVHAVVERCLVDDGVDESAEVTHVAHLDFLQHTADGFLHGGPHALGHVGAAGGGAFLALEFEGAAHDGGGHLVHVGALVHKDEVLAARLADNLGIGAVVGYVVADGFPEVVEGAGGAGEVDAGEVLVGEGHLADERAAAGQEVDDAVGQAGLLVYLHQDVVREQRGGAGFPQAHVAHQRRREAEVAGDGGEVERRDSEHEALHGAIVDIVQLTLGAAGLVAVYLAGVVGVVSQEVNQFAGGVDFGLHGGLALAEHGGGIDQVAVFAGNEGGYFQHHAGAVHPRRVGPLLVRLHGGGDGGLHLLLAHLVVACQDVLVLRRHDNLAHIIGFHLLAADDDGNFGNRVVELVERFADFLTFGTAGRVAFHRLVLGLREYIDAVVHWVGF